MARRDRGSGDGNGQRAQAVLAGAERAAPPRDARRRRAGRGVGRAGRAAEVPVVAAHGGRLQVERVVDEDLRGPLGHRGRRVGQGVAWRWRRRAGQGAVNRAVVQHRRSRLVPGQRRGQPGRDGRGAVGPGAQLRERERHTWRSGSNISKTHIVTVLLQKQQIPPKTKITQITKNPDLEVISMFCVSLQMFR